MGNEDIGYLKRAVEDLTAMIKDHMEQEEDDRKAITKRLKNIEDELNTYKIIYRGLKWVIALVLLIITMKFGDIPKMFGK